MRVRGSVTVCVCAVQRKPTPTDAERAGTGNIYTHAEKCTVHAHAHAHIDSSAVVYACTTLVHYVCVYVSVCLQCCVCVFVGKTQRDVRRGRGNLIHIEVQSHEYGGLDICAHECVYELKHSADDDDRNEME